MANAGQTLATLNALRSLGVGLAIDDFGTGYSSLAYLKRLPINTLTIDREFIGDLTRNPDDEAITTTVIVMVHSLGLTVITEGVETQAQMQFLRGRGCDEIQGYWLTQSLEAADCLAFIRAWTPPQSMQEGGPATSTGLAEHEPRESMRWLADRPGAAGLIATEPNVAHSGINQGS